MDRADPTLEGDGLHTQERLAILSNSDALNRESGEIYVCVQHRVIVHELPEHQRWIRFERGVERKEDLTVFLDRQMLDVVHPI